MHVLAKVMSDPSSPPASKVAAACNLLRFSRESIELDDLAARVESLCKTLGRTVVVSSAFAAAYGGELVSLGRHELKDVEGSQELFTLP